MDWAEEIKTSFRKTTARKGRRAKSRDALDTTIPSISTTSSSSKFSSDSAAKKEKNFGIMLNIKQIKANTPYTPCATSPTTSTLNINSEIKAPRRRIPGGWADNTIVRTIKSKDSNDDKGRFEINTDSKSVRKSSLVDDIPIIPDLDDVKDEVLMNEIVEPPNVSENRVKMLKELNLDLLSQNAFSAVEGVDLTILTRCLRTQEELNEPDEVWEWNKLFADVMAEIHAEDLKHNSSSAAPDV